MAEPNNIAFISGETKSMDEAFTFAQQTIDELWKAWDSDDDGYSDFAIKIGIITGIESPEVEHIWFGLVNKIDNGFVGYAAADSIYSNKIQEGQRIEFPVTKICDWQFAYSGKVYGHFTTRILLQDMTDGQQSETLDALGWNTIDG